MPAQTSTPASIWGRISAWILLIGLLALVAVQLASAQKGVLSRGEQVPVFALTTFDGETYRSEEMSGKVVLVNFWASWCKPCEQEAGALEAAWEKYELRGDVLFLGVDYVDPQNDALAYIERFSISYPNGPDIGTNIFHLFRARGVPETFVINKLGEVAFVTIGPFSNSQEISTAIDRLLEP